MAYKLGADLPFDEVFKRISEKTEITTSTDLAKVLGISGPSISRQKSNNSFPAAWLVLLAAKFGIDLNYLAFGEEICRKPVTCDEDLETIAISYFNSRHPDISSKISSAERAIIVGEVKTLLDRFAQHLKSAE
ncbi:MAG: hypothetical protein CVU60_12420 [Deltaproteobacteria bacterium HGW-Deltaproteobacteria-18]|jgi:hypothetical protein|nr:MAG: hypothetical protein CVU60_12420 [Deltaproteobacteria bacterium HGW-Deltaproteobacteria-18]